MNQASVNKDLKYTSHVLSEKFPGKLKAIFSPQHGIWGEQQANMIESHHAYEPHLGVPIFSLYSETRAPTEEMLAKIEYLIIDLQDVGTRIYTFIWTLKNCLQACAKRNLPLVVLDRPNPLGGIMIEGPLLEPEYSSFVGELSIPMRHGLTIGEAALLMNKELNIQADLEVISLKGWTRDLLFSDLNRTWIPPSPNLPQLKSVTLYPGQVLFEGTNISEGRGTTTPFELVGAPFVDPEVLTDHLHSFNIPGVTFIPIRFLPTFDKWAGESCGGIRIHINHEDRFSAYKTSLLIIMGIHDLWPQKFAWLSPPYEYEYKKMPIDILSGSTKTRLDITQHPASHDLLQKLSFVNEKTWWDRVRSILLYESNQ